MVGVFGVLQTCLTIIRMSMVLYDRASQPTSVNVSGNLFLCHRSCVEPTTGENFQMCGLLHGEMSENSIYDKIFPSEPSKAFVLSPVHINNTTGR